MNRITKRDFIRTFSTLQAIRQYISLLNKFTELQRNHKTKYNILVITIVLMTPLFNYIILEIAKLFDNSKTQHNLTIYKFISQTNFTKYKKLISNVTNIRHKIIAHNDILVQRDRFKFEKKNQVSLQQMDNLIEESIKILDKFNRPKYWKHNSLVNMSKTDLKLFKDELEKFGF